MTDRHVSSADYRDTGSPRASGDGRRRRFARWATGWSIRSRRSSNRCRSGPVTRDASPSAVRDALTSTARCRNRERTRARCWSETAQLLFDHSLFNGHPRFFGYITASPAPIGMLGDFLAAAVNAERRRLDAVAGRHRDRGADGALDRGADRLPGDVRRAAGQRRQHGQRRLLPGRARGQGRTGTCERRALHGGGGRRLRVYASAETHTWIQKATDLAGSAPTRSAGSPPTASCAWTSRALRRQIDADRAAGDVPCLVVGTAGSVSTGAVDPLPEIGALCREYGVWFHVDGAYGGFAAAVPDAPDDLRGAQPGRLGGRRSAQVALRAARGRLRAGARSGARCAPRSPTTRRTTTSKSRRPTTSTTARRTRAASARSRCGWRCSRSAPPATAR